MFNNFFFEGSEGQKRFDKFLQESPPGKTALVIDPPFGGLIQAISRTIDKIHGRWMRGHSSEKNNEDVTNKLKPDSYQMAVFIVLPWFLEPKVDKFLHGMTMSDYKVEYSGHTESKSCSCKNKFGSAVRIFTNLKTNLLVLPASEGYKFCDECQKYTASTNKHCYKCKACTSKDGNYETRIVFVSITLFFLGTPSYHCKICDRCFKNTWVHCKVCNICSLPKHCKCNDKQKSAK